MGNVFREYKQKNILSYRCILSFLYKLNLCSIVFYRDIFDIHCDQLQAFIESQPSCINKMTKTWNQMGLIQDSDSEANVLIVAALSLFLTF